MLLCTCDVHVPVRSSASVCVRACVPACMCTPRSSSNVCSTMQFNTVQLILFWDVCEAGAIVTYGSLGWTAGHAGDQIVMDIWDGSSRIALERSSRFPTAVPLRLGCTPPLLQIRSCQQALNFLAPLPPVPVAAGICPQRPILADLSSNHVPFSGMIRPPTSSSSTAQFCTAYLFTPTLSSNNSNYAVSNPNLPASVIFIRRYRD